MNDGKIFCGVINVILYFSATGNSQYVAEQISAATSDKMISIRQAIASGEKFFTLAENEAFGLVTPTYFAGLPSIVRNFLDEMKLQVAGGKHYVYLGATFGGNQGNIRTETTAAFQKLGLELNASFGVCMVDNWLPYFDLTDEKYLREAEAKVEPNTREVVEKISRHELDQLPKSFSDEEGEKYRALYETLRHTEKFSVNEKCIGCGKCVRQCPLKVIALKDKHPVWTKELCTLCLGCLHACPVNAINFDGKTEGRGQYHNPRVRRIV